MILRGEPENKDVFMDHSRDRDKIMLARDKGAAGVIFISGMNYDPRDSFPEQRGKEPSVGIPVLQLKREAADHIMQGTGFEVTRVEKKAGPGGMQTLYLSKKNLEAQIGMTRTYARTGNVAGMIEGSDPVLKHRMDRDRGP